MTRSAVAAAVSRPAMTSQGLSRSESETMQKSWPSGAPTRLATTCAAVRPGTIRIGTSFHCGSSLTSSTAAAIANTPGSPDETTATRRPRLARSRANAARSASTRLSERCRRWRGLGATRSTYGP
jgi:hypothetical protein